MNIADRSLRVALTGVVHDDDPTIIADMMVRIEELEGLLSEAHYRLGGYVHVTQSAADDLCRRIRDALRFES